MSNIADFPLWAIWRVLYVDVFLTLPLEKRSSRTVCTIQYNHHQKNGEKWPISILVILFFLVLGPFLSQGWSDSFLVFCIFSGILRHKFRVPTRGTLENFYFWPIKGPWPFWRALGGSKTTSKYNFIDRQVELSSAKLSRSSWGWGWVELRLIWVEAELELNSSWDWAWQVFELFNWSI